MAEAPPPTPPPEDRAAAFRRAADIRRERSQLVDQVRSGEMPLADALDPAAGGEVRPRMLVSAIVVLALGERHTDEVLARAGVTATQRVHELSEQQRTAILHAAAEHP